MEIKKYVLLEDKTIFDCRNARVHFADTHLVFNSGMVIGKVLKMSNNILDLVEVGDLVEEEDGNLIKVETIYIGDNEINFQNWLYNIYDYQVKSIYKKQPNGDYKRYEVKE